MLEKRRADFAVRITVEQRLDDEAEQTLRLSAIDLEWVHHGRRGGRIRDDEFQAGGPRGDGRGPNQQRCERNQQDAEDTTSCLHLTPPVRWALDLEPPDKENRCGEDATEVP